MNRTPRTRTVAASALALVGALLLAACGTSGPEPETVEGSAYMPEPVTAKLAAGYVTLANQGDEDDALVSVSSELSDDVTLHRSVDNTMKKVDSLPVPAGEKLELRTGGDHLMFHDLTRLPREGDTVTVELRFSKSAPLTLEVPVRAKTYQPGADGAEHSEHADGSGDGDADSDARRGGHDEHAGHG
ncbi:MULTISPECIES: copper chaperone PCu(A)C [unclassified Streptomyces]|uniref:copper chaperone PCu(A)C n=1 Tax=unclassified Streptomyces TaxID=2593676 RepID=UPI0022B6E502|nr:MULTISPECIES: copper chaperone PCu(A)C [unclassified Streptomyces]MCZ7417599.1 copper chaperone PCu(A)C [Streptomyces sp. WMMC897]MCZ7432591.1 copper chaperone PCu(A)C [Streptomyces sp. WMMC1477]